MNNRMTFYQYRRMDLMVFGVMLMFAEGLIVLAATRWFPAEAYTVSAAAAVVSIVMMRWGPFAAAHAVLAGAVFCFFSGGAPGQYLIYCAGNLFALISLVFFRIFGKERIREDGFLTVAFAIATQFFMQLGRAAVAFMLLMAAPGSAPAGTDALSDAAAICFGFFTTDALSGLFTAVILWIARRQDGLFEDQKHYLLRIQKAEKEERGEV